MPLLSTRGAATVRGFGFGGRTVLPYIAALGGTILTSGCYKTHVFTGDGTFQVTNEGTPLGSNSVEYFVIAGGGPGGGPYRGAGAGGGGYRTNYPSPAFAGTPVIYTSYPIQVGAGGGNPSSRYSDATPSIFSTITSTRGGSHGQPGGSGGGNNGTSGQGTGNDGGFSPPEGNPGGNSAGGCSPGGGGGGGANAPGNNGAPGFTSPAGSGGAGKGIGTTFFGPTAPSYGTPGPDGAQRYFSGGGGGGTYSPGSPGGGGYGGGGTASSPSPAYSGGGGGGGNTAGMCSTPSFGGSGLVAIRYKYK